MKNQRLLSFIILLILTIVLSGCNAPAPVVPTSTLQPTAKPTETRLTLKPCTITNTSIKAECGYFHVPEDRSKPNGRILDLWMIKVPAQGPNHAPDPLFYIAGGPGAAATSNGIVYSVSTLFKEVNQERDVIFLDQRGTNDKHRLFCEDPSFNFSDASQQQVNDWMNECLSNFDADPRFYTTAVAMQDLDDLRAALGYEKINLYGISYGTVAIQAYMRMFPERVRAAVLDHGTALDVTFTEARPRAEQSALEQVLTYCEQDEQCHAAYPDIRDEWKALLERFSKGPVVTNFTVPGETKPYQVGLDDLAAGIHDLLYNSGTYKTLPTLVHTFATTADWTPLVENSYQEQKSSGDASIGKLVMLHMIECFEPWWGTNAEAIDRLNQGSYYRQAEVKGAQNVQKLCAALPKPDASLIYPPGKPVPLSALMVNSLIDPQNTPSNMEPALKEFTKSRLVVEPTEGHNTTSSGCRWDIIAQYIQLGSVDVLDISCMAQQKPSFEITG